jgi:molybdopterin-guanine dinucleotide biosynthesis protein A
MEAVLQKDGRRIVDFFSAVTVTELPAEKWKRFDPEGLSFRNINTPQDYFTLRESRQAMPQKLQRVFPAE